MYTPEDEIRRETIKPTEPYRSPWRRDYARIIHSPCFRRLQGKTQLFPGHESDFFRNRLTHSLEVAQIAKSIAIRLNSTENFLSKKNHKISEDIVEIAGLCHDIGHPPFGHNGEIALDRCMAEYGGFEGNAQTLRILARLEKRGPQITKSSDNRTGLNLTARTLASILKYDFKIPWERKGNNYKGVVKGFYNSESETVKWMKNQVIEKRKKSTLVQNTKFKTIECQIMDIADDIAYSTYDLEDAFKANFLTPLDMLSLLGNKEIMGEVTKKVNGGLKNEGIEEVTEDQISDQFYQFFESIFISPKKELVNLKKQGAGLFFAALYNNISHRIANNGNARAEFTSGLVGKFIRNVKFEANEECPPLSIVKLGTNDRILLEVFKRFTYVTLIKSSRLKIVQFRGKTIVDTIFKALDEDSDGYRLLPDDFRDVYNTIDEKDKKRVLCDFIAGMTDRYALEFYGRLISEKPETIYKPL